MNYYISCIIIFLIAYLVNMTYITVFYHLGFAHNAVLLKPRLRRFVVRTGNWITGLDAKGWACMHRLHHMYSDLPKDPHSPSNVGVIGVMSAQLRAYKKCLILLIKGDLAYTSIVEDLDFP